MSEVERGGGSFTAEQLIEVLRLFNADIGEFLPQAEADDELQNAMIQYGATHLRPVPGVVKTNRYSSASETILATLLDSRASRLVASIAPVLFKNIESISLPGLQLWLQKSRREHRLGWLLENVRDALLVAPPGADGAWKRAAARTIAVLDGALDHISPGPGSSGVVELDLFDPTIRSRRTQDLIWEGKASEISRRWGIVSELQPDDFREALWSACGLD